MRASASVCERRESSSRRRLASPSAARRRGRVPTIYVFASKAGAPIHPEWYRNLVAGGGGRVEIGDDEYDVEATELTGADRDRIFAEQAGRYPGFAEYADKTAGIRTIPVLALRRGR